MCNCSIHNISEICSFQGSFALYHICHVIYNLTASSKGCKLGERLLSRAPHTDEQRMATVDANYAVNPGQMFQSIIKQYKVHPGFVLIVLLQNFL